MAWAALALLGHKTSSAGAANCSLGTFPDVPVPDFKKELEGSYTLQLELTDHEKVSNGV